MATLIPAIGSSAFDSTGERRLAERLEQKLDADYLLWHNVPIGPKQTHPDFVVLHARRGLLVLETKDWRLQTVQNATRQAWTILDNGRPKVVINPLAQARHCAIQVVNALERDPQLVQAEGPHKGKLAFPWGHGVVFTRITRKEFETSGLAETIDPHYVICQDEMLEHADPEEFQQRLWNMFAHRFGGAITLPQLDRVRWIMFPQVRVQTQGALFDDNDADAQLPDIMRVMDLQQEQLARSLGDGHRVIHGVAGSGKTMVLGYRAEYLAFYSFRMYFLVFHGEERYDQNPEAHHDDHHGGHSGKPHESPWVVTLPLVLLAVPSVFIGFLTVQPMLFGEFFKDVIFVDARHGAMAGLEGIFHGPLAMAVHALQTAPFWLALAGVVTAYYMYMINPALPAAIKKSMRPIYSLLENKYYMDWFNENVLARFARILGAGLWKVGDQALIDGAVVNGSWKCVGWIAGILRWIQSGYIFHYALIMLLGVFGLMTYFVWLNK